MVCVYIKLGYYRTRTLRPSEPLEKKIDLKTRRQYKSSNNKHGRYRICYRFHSCQRHDLHQGQSQLCWRQEHWNYQLKYQAFSNGFYTNYVELGSQCV